MPQRCTVLVSIKRNTTFSTASPIRMMVSRPANTSGMSSWFLLSKMYQPSPPYPDDTPNTSSAAISVRQANAQPILRPARMLGNAAGMSIRATKRNPLRL